MRQLGRNIPVSLNRALVLDICAISARIPQFPVEINMPLDSLAETRRQSHTRISWAALFLRAYGLVSREEPLLRTSFLTWPWLHMVEHPSSMAMVTVHRTFQGEDRLCFGRVRSPESMSLSEIQKWLDYFKNSPVEVAFPCQLRLSRRSRWFRAAYWWLRRNCSGRRYGGRIGTFGMSSLAGQGTLNRGHPSIHTTSITYGPLDEAGSSLVTLQCDHRVIDGMAASRCLMRLQYVMLGQVQQELEELGATEEEKQAAPFNHAKRAMPERI